jgi:hypothetical protein
MDPTARQVGHNGKNIVARQNQAREDGVNQNTTEEGQSGQ